MRHSIGMGIQDRETLESVFSRHKHFAQLARNEPIKSRKERLEKLRKWIHYNRPAIHEAMYADFQKNATEVDAIEIFHVLAEITHAQKNLEKWAKPLKVDAPVTLIGTRSYIQCEPLGVCLVISPWNYPFSLCLGPLVSALAAGNAVVLKPSEFTPHVSDVIARLVSEVFEPSVVSVFNGDKEISQQLLKLPFDHVFFTGSPAVGKIVMKAAAENLASVTLELGGKCPAIVDGSSSLRPAAQRIAFTKFLNNGQTCVAPDYVLVEESIRDRFLDELINQVRCLFTTDGEPFEVSKDYCRIINEKQFLRLNALLQDAITNGANVELGGNQVQSTRFFHPTILSRVPLTAKIMEEEIFGPILPVISYQRIDDAISIVNSRPKPLALYIFSNTNDVRKKVLRETSAGGVCINDCGIHFMQHNLPFGGVNNSGMGRSHGHFGFQAFSNQKAVLKQRNGFTSIKVFYPPYTDTSRKIMDWFLKLF